MKFALACLLSCTASTAALAVGQLPNTVKPTLYDLTIEPDAAAMRFRGQEAISVTVAQPTPTITLNAAELDITSATLDSRTVPFTLDAASQTLTLRPAGGASAGAHVIRFAWSGKINTTAAGFFAIDYTNQDGSKARMLATQFEAPDARRFAPMFDEPAFKAHFRLSTIAPANQTAFSNMPAASVVKQPDGRKLYHFGEAPLMSSYLLFLGIGDIERRTVMSGRTEIGVITRRGVSQQGDYALAQAKRLLAYYNNYFGQPYPLPKLDMIAGPGSSQFFGAMENWGAIFYFEPELLLDPKRGGQSQKERVFIVVAHEMAHQWFGDLVTMKWWDDIWLNEGFASWMENKTAQDLNPSWQADATAVADDREIALALDSTAASHPIIRHVETVDQIGEAFDQITYQKGQAVIRMLEATLGPDPFRAGIRRYMAKYNHQNTATDQLWAELEAATGKPVAGIAHDFTLQAGVPLITLDGASCAGGFTTATLSQGRFGLDAPSKRPQSWRVPLKLAVVGGGTTSAVVQGPRTVVRIQGCGPVVLNQGKASYTRTMYDAADHAALVRGFDRLALTDQLGTLGDDMALARGGYEPLDRWTADLAMLRPAADPLLWRMAARQLGGLDGLYEGTPLAAPLRARSAALLAPVLARIGVTPREGDSPATQTLRESLIGGLGAAGDPQVTAEARRYVAALRTNPDAIPAGIRQAILGVYAYNATPAEWETLLAMARAERNPVVKNTYVALLGAAKDPALAARALELLKSSDFTAPQKASLIRSVAAEHPEAAFAFAVANTDLVSGWLETSTRAGFIVGLGAASNDPAMPGRITAWGEKNLAPEARGGMKRALTQIAVRRDVAERLRPGVQGWLGAR